MNKKIISVRLDRDRIRKIDGLAVELKKTRTEIIESAVKEYIKRIHAEKI